MTACPVLAAEANAKPKTLFTNVNVLAGKSEKLMANANVLVEGNLIKQVSQEAIDAAGAAVIDKGLIEGPRILPSGAFISQSSGHGDFDPHDGREPHEGHSHGPFDEAFYQKTSENY